MMTEEVTPDASADLINELSAVLRELLEWQEWLEEVEGCGGLVSEMNRAREVLAKAGKQA